MAGLKEQRLLFITCHNFFLESKSNSNVIFLIFNAKVVITLVMLFLIIQGLLSLTSLCHLDSPISMFMLFYPYLLLLLLQPNRALYTDVVIFSF